MSKYNENLISIISDFIGFYKKNSEFPVDIITLVGLYIHVYLYQKFDKKIETTNNNPKILIILISICFVVDLFSVFMKKIKFNKLANVPNKKNINYLYLLVIYTLFFYKIFANFSVEGYVKYFTFFKFLFFTSTLLRIGFNLFGYKHYSDIAKLIETVYLTNIILISLSDPHYNTNEIPNIVCFHEIFFRYMEFHILVFSFYFIYNDANIEDEISKQIYSISSIIGRYDSFRYFTVLNLTHYLFILINGISYSINYWIGFSSIFINFLSIISYRQRNIKQCYISTGVLLLWNILTYSYALIKTAPNIGTLAINENFNNTLS